MGGVWYCEFWMSYVAGGGMIDLMGKVMMRM